MLSSAGFEWYEISNWSRHVDHRSVHNQRYWHDANWLGFGPGAHSHWEDQRWWNTSRIDRYLDGTTVSAGERLSTANRVLERVMLGLRLAAGVVVPESIASSEFRNEICELKDRGLIVIEAERPDNRAVQVAATDRRDVRLSLTLEGRLLANQVVSDIWAALKPRTQDRPAPSHH
jgi:oxygen-independent coproporphyrinogen-3 oxidase